MPPTFNSQWGPCRLDLVALKTGAEPSASLGLRRETGALGMGHTAAGVTRGEVERTRKSCQWMLTLDHSPFISLGLEEEGPSALAKVPELENGDLQTPVTGRICEGREGHLLPVPSPRLPPTPKTCPLFQACAIPGSLECHLLQEVHQATH